MHSNPDGIPISLFRGVDQLAADLFGVRDIRHWSAMLKLNKAPPNALTGVAVVEQMFAQVEGNWTKCLSILSRPPSTQNWRWFEPQLEISPENRSPEVTLERAIVRAAKAADRRDWSNQIPIAAGILAGAGNNRRAIDLVHSPAPEKFEFVELKIASDTPLFAAIEILEYGFIWLLSRRDGEALGYADRAIIQASDIQLSVLAPRSYYRELDLTWLTECLSEGVRRLGLRQGDMRLDFAFQEFPQEFVWPDVDATTEVLAALDSRRAR